MNANRELERDVRSWLREDGHEDADRVLFTVLDQLDRTPQRHASWLARRFPILNSNTVRYGMAGVAVVVLMLLGLSLISETGIGGPPATPTPRPTPVPTATPAPMPNDALDAGRYIVRPFPADESIGISFTVPSGWEGFLGKGLLPTTGAAGPDGMGIGFETVSRLYRDPCHDSLTSVGPEVDDLVAAFRANGGYQTTEPVDVVIDGFSGVHIALVMPTDVDFGVCDNDGYFVWEGSIYAQGPGNRWDLSILDVEGTRVVILAQTNPETSAADRAELQAILDSIQIES